MHETEHRGVIAWFTRNTVAANLLMGLIVVGGLLILPVLKKEVFPDMNVASITISVAYPGAAPSEVEESVCRRIEEAVESLTGVKRITSRSAENSGTVTVELLPGVEGNAVLTDVKNRVDAIDTFPVEAEEPIVQELVVRRQAIEVAISGDIDERTLKTLGQRVRDDLARLPEITQIDLVAVREDEIAIEVAEESLRRYGLTFDQVANAVRRASLDLPGGVIETTGGEVLLRAKGQAYRSDEFAELTVVSRPDGTRVKLADVARVVDGFADVDQWARFDGQPTALVQIYRVGDQSALDISAAVHAYIERMQPAFPEGVKLTAWRDQTRLLRSRMELLLRNAGVGLLLVFLVLALFLRFKLAFWVSLGVPVSFLGAISLMSTFEVSINMISLFAFIVVLGIVVDDAIVVGESVFKELRAGKNGYDAAVIGSKRVAVPVVFGVMTTVAAFSPMFNVDTNARELWRQIPLIVIPCLLFSLVESKLILPAHLSHERPFGEQSRRRGLGRLAQLGGRVWEFVQIPFTAGMQWFIQRVYRPSLGLCLRWRYVTWTAGTCLLAVTLSLVGAGFIRFQFFPAVEGENVVGSVTMPLGTPVDATAAAVQQMEAAALELQAELQAAGGADQGFDHVLTSVGEQPYKVEQRANAGQFGETLQAAHLGEINIQLPPSEDRTISAEEVLRRWRDKIGAIPGAVEVSFTSSIVSSGEDVNVQLSATRIDTLRRAADEVKAKLATYAGVADITDSLRAGKRELRLSIRPEAETLGLTLADLARQVRQAFYGEEAQRVQRNRDDVKVMVRYPEADRRSLGDLEDMRIRTASGAEVPLSVVAHIEEGRGYATIKRTDLARSVNVTGDVDETQGSPTQIVADLRQNFLPAFRAAHPDVSISFEGDSSDQERTLASLGRGALVALFAIYALMAIPFRSYLQPLIVMIAIPFGLVGAIWGHVAMGMDLSIISVLGLVALTGVVVNDSLVLVDYVNQRRQMGEPLVDSVQAAGIVRFRPILLTSLTTFASLTPMLLERSIQARFLVPMAVSLAFGVLFATVICLVLVPSGYLILEDLKRAWAWFIGPSPTEGRAPASPSPPAVRTQP
ncbi:MAG: efflux RND transporter permease subunit [Planctomycetota bacterium]